MPSKDLVEIEKMMIEKDMCFSDLMINSLFAIGIDKSPCTGEDILFVTGSIIERSRLKYVVYRSDLEWDDLVEFNSYLKRVLSL